MSDNAIMNVEPSMRLGSLAVTDVIATAGLIAKELAKIVNDRKLFSVISGRKFVRVEGWSTMGAMLGVLPREKVVEELENGDFHAVVELIRTSDGAVIGQGSAIVGADESTWNKRPRYARRSMALTRATGKAYRLGFSWIISLAGYETTPAEEMDGIVEGEVREPIPQEHNAPIPNNGNLPAMDIKTAMAVMTSEKEPRSYGSLSDEELNGRVTGIQRALKNNHKTPEEIADLQYKLSAAIAILNERGKAKK